MIFFQPTKEDKVKFNTPNLSICKPTNSGQQNKAPYLRHYAAYNLPPPQAEVGWSQTVFVGNF